MFFLFGSYVLRRTVDRGRFWCPTCLRETEYTLRRGRWFIHLFFIPLIPLAAAPEQVRCEECHAAYPPAVLLGGRAMSVEHAVPGPSLDPTRRSVSPGPGPTVDGEAVLAARAVVVGVLSLAPVVSHPGMRAGVDLVRSTGERSYDLDHLSTDLAELDASVLPGVLERRRGEGRLHPEQARVLVTEAARVAAANGEVTARVRDAVVHLGVLAGLTRGEAEEAAAAAAIS
ncbi:hypothetical protein [Serinibacter salmoneus]|uniref:Uncharacterized protein n=1 Tax=Serinibacter salmoneus TaxID=556530 RepID=A0A2A9D0L1_9MICO|nr:hypothetical protein [Serinibacter salmoneus]PFG19795.1 hypothetical protein ATL40_1366 [Serinibacter salmoneus]